MRCTCRLADVYPTDIDPPERVRDPECPEHGDEPDTMEPYDRERDDAMWDRQRGWGRG